MNRLTYGWLKGLFTITMLIILLIMEGCSSSPRNLRPNFIIIVVDTMREDLGGAEAPFFSSLKKRGVYFNNTYTTIPITLPAHLSLFTSKYPWELGITNNGLIYTGSTKLLAEILREKRYTTMAAVSLGTVHSSTGISRGFEYYSDNFPKTRCYKNAAEVNQAIFPMLKKIKKPFFLWVHYSDPHEPYAPPYLEPDGEVLVNGKKAGEVNFLKKELFFVKGKPGETVRVTVKLNKRLRKRENYKVKIGEAEKLIFLKRKNKVSFNLTLNEEGEGKIKPVASPTAPLAHEFYKEEVNYWDSQFKFLYKKLEKMGLLKNTYLFILADHGEGMGEWKKHLGHVHFLNAVYTRIPLLMLTPDGKKGERKELRSIMDIFPTVLKIAKIPLPQDIKGIDLFKKEGHPYLFQETFKPEAILDRFSLLKGSFLLIHTPEKKEFLFFNLKKDRLGIHPIEFTSETQGMIGMLLKYEKKVIPMVKERKGNMTPAQIKHQLRFLKSLGYVK